MLLNDSYLIEEIEGQHPEYTHFIDELMLIDNMVAGGFITQKRRRDYLLIRDDEDPKITEKREEKFAPLNHLASALRLQRTKLSTGSIEYPDAEEVAGNTELWNKFLSDCDGEGTDLKEKLIEAFEQAQVARTVFAFVDLPAVEDEAANARQQELMESARRSKGEVILPYITLIPTQNVINWGEDARGLSWIKYKCISEQTQPVGPGITSVMWVFIDRENITVYALDDVQLDEEGSVLTIREGDGYRFFNQIEDRIPQIYSQPHKRGAIPVEKMTIPFSMWTTNQVSHIQKLLYGLFCNACHTTVNSGFVQKWLEPYFQQGNSAVQLPQELLKKVMEEVSKHQGDESTLSVKSFNFAEMEGKGVDVQLKVIDILVEYIYSCTSLNVASVSKDVLEQSGRSKEFDMYLAEQALVGYGALLVKFGQKLLRHVARAFGIQKPAELEKITLRGFDEFKLDSLEDCLERLVNLAKVADLHLPPLAEKMLMKNLVTTASKYASDEEVDAAMAQLDDMFDNMPFAEEEDPSADNPEDVKALMESEGIDEDTALSVLRGELPNG